MQSLKITFKNVSEETQDILVAMMAEAGYDGFEQMDDQLMAYIQATSFDVSELTAIAGEHKFAMEAVVPKNWNEEWEKNFEPIILDGFCTIRAHFHDITVTTPYDIVITPKMSFGTGHHATTQLMMRMMEEMEIDLEGKHVLDFGTGTGVLAILAEKLGAAYVLGIDNEEWAVANAEENVQRNACKNIMIMPSTGDQLPPIGKDLILANINRNVLFQYMPQLYYILHKGGTLLLSGILTTDMEAITAAARKEGFNKVSFKEMNGWVAMKFTK